MKKLTSLSGFRDIRRDEKHNSEDKTKKKKSLGVTHFCVKKEEVLETM
jgi:hypothetical protein